MFNFVPKWLVFCGASQFKYDSTSDSSSARYIPWYSAMNCVNLTYFPNAVNWYLFNQEYNTSVTSTVYVYGRLIMNGTVFQWYGTNYPFNNVKGSDSSNPNKYNYFIIS